MFIELLLHYEYARLRIGNQDRFQTARARRNWCALFVATRDPPPGPTVPGDGAA
jgi:hypothetical protein